MTLRLRLRSARPLAAATLRAAPRGSLSVLLVGIIATSLVAAGIVVYRTAAPADKTVTAYFPRAVSLFEGSEVRILGVRVGTVTTVVPDGETVRVRMTYDEQQALPKDVRAVIITPSLTADRFVQLTPAYVSGPRLADGGEIAVERTGVPIELDRIYRSLADLSDALGPTGANKNGQLNDLLAAGDDLLAGQGERANQTIRDLATSMETLGDGSEDLFATVESLNRLTTTLARNDATVARFMTSLGTVSQELAAEDEELVAALAALSAVLADVERFVKDNRGRLSGSVKDLSQLTGVLADYHKTIEDVIATAPLAMGNLVNAHDPVAGVVNARLLIKESVADLDGILCTLVKNGGVTGADDVCRLFEVLLEPVMEKDGVPAEQAGGAFARDTSELLGATP